MKLCTYKHHGQPCSEAKHQALKSMNPHKVGMKDGVIVNSITHVFECFLWIFRYTVSEEDGVRCRCCGTLLS